MDHDELRTYFERFLPPHVKVKGLPLKHVSFPIAVVGPHPQSRRATPRAIAALAAAAASADCGLEEGAICSRRLIEPRCVIENGVARDIAKSGLARIVRHRGEDAFQITAAGAAAVRKQVSAAVLAEYGWCKKPFSFDAT